jgi:hypothetical protein
MGDLILFTYNIAETGTVSMSGTPDTGYPASRLYDRSKNIMWKDADNIARTFQIDQGATIKDIDLLWIANHNFDGEDITWEYSDNGSSWSDAVTGWTQGGNDPIVKIFPDSDLSHRYWKVTITSLANAVCGEIFMGYGYTFPIMDKPIPAHGYLDNVQWSRSVGGQERGIKRGESRERRAYTLRLESADLANFLLAVDDLDGFSLPFLIKDKDDNYYLMRFDRIPSRGYLANIVDEIDINLVEMV